MAIAHIVISGNEQAVQLPKEYRFKSTEVEIFRRGDEVVLREHTPSATGIFDLLASFPDDFMADGRQDAPPQQREPL